MWKRMLSLLRRVFQHSEVYKSLDILRPEVYYCVYDRFCSLEHWSLLWRIKSTSITTSNLYLGDNYMVLKTNKRTNSKSENKNPSHSSLPYLNLTFLPIFPLMSVFNSLSRGLKRASFMSQIQLKGEAASSSLVCKNIRRSISTALNYHWTQKETKFDNMHILYQAPKCRLQSFPLNHWPIPSEENDTLKKKHSRTKLQKSILSNICRNM